MLKSKIKKILYELSVRYNHLKVSIIIEKKWYGNNYGGFYANPDLINQDSIVYSFGIGADISFDEAIIKNHNCTVYGFDPTPKSIDWIKNKKNIPEKFIF